MPFVLLIAYIVIEIALFIWIGGWIGVGWTLLWVLACFPIGIWMLRKGGAESRKWLESAQKGDEMPPATKQVYWYIGGLLVILPGFFTDILGLMLVFPPTQAVVTWFGSLFVPEFVQSGFSYAVSVNSARGKGSREADPDVIEGQAIEIDAPSANDRSTS